MKTNYFDVDAVRTVLEETKGKALNEQIEDLDTHNYDDDDLLNGTPGLSNSKSA
jgi:hypothetical protein